MVKPPLIKLWSAWSLSRSGGDPEKWQDFPESWRAGVRGRRKELSGSGLAWPCYEGGSVYPLADNASTAAAPYCKRFLRWQKEFSRQCSESTSVSRWKLASVDVA